MLCFSCLANFKRFDLSFVPSQDCAVVNVLKMIFLDAFFLTNRNLAICPRASDVIQKC